MRLKKSKSSSPFLLDSMEYKTVKDLQRLLELVVVQIRNVCQGLKH